ncbi:methylated-DNA--[protein]-cysteine S-methyltransferase [Candidatus Bathyarchaeota archaeon]|nr:methylated-DNA--[protein]-cysteine S-methyltransferase [Candidatus Bathyarchaeota archaeon]
MRPIGEGVVYYDGMLSPIGEIWIAGSEQGLLKIDLRISEEHFLADLRKITPSKPIRDAMKFPKIEGRLEEYFRGNKVIFDIPLDLRGTEFQRDVWRAIYKIPYGRLSSYGRIAEEIGRPRAVRAVGNAVGANPLPIVIPCHRIIRADGGLGGYGGGIDLKLYLLSIEGIIEMSHGWSKIRAKNILKTSDNLHL